MSDETSPKPKRRCARVRARGYCFTINNYAEEDVGRLREIDFEEHRIRFLVCGREVGASGTPHLQGYVQFLSARDFAIVKRMLPAGAHIEAAKGTPRQNYDYCTKEGEDIPLLLRICPLQRSSIVWDFANETAY